MTGLRPRLRALSRIVVLLVPTGVFAVLWLSGETGVVAAAAIAVAFLVFGAWRLRAESAVASERMRLEQLIDAIPLAIGAFDGAARVVTWNRAAERLFGWRADEIVGQPNPIVAPRDREQSAELHRRLLAGESLQGIEVERVARDGTVLELAIFTAPLDPEAGAAGGFLVLYESIAERKRAERERDEAQQRYRGLVEALPLVTYIDQVDDHATNVYTSPQIEQLLGWTHDDWIEDPCLFEELLHPDDRQRVMDLVVLHNAARSLFEAEYRLRHRDGHYVWVRDHSAIVEDPDGEPYARGFLLDITEQKRLEEQLLQSQKMDALGQFAGGIAHDFNNLLTGIGGYADLASRGVEQGSPIERALAGIKSAAGEAASLTSRLLAFSRRNVPTLELIDLNDVVRTSAELLARLVRADVTVSLELEEQLPPVAADLAQLRQVVLNLALNGRDAMASGGVLTLATSRRDGLVVLRVTDTGCGMDDATRQRALEPFFTTKAEGEGTGLGLAVVYGVVDALGGSITLRSAPREGTTVEVLLPAAEGSIEELGVEVPGDRRGGQERVLVVEDRDVVRNLTRDVLEDAGFEVVAVPGGHEALAAAEARPFDLLVSDVVMPEMSGPILAGELRSRHPSLPVLFMSGYTDDVLGADELEQPRTAFLRKPFGSAELVGSVRALLDEVQTFTVARLT